MPIQVKYFASLRDRLGREGDRVDPSQAKTVADVWSVVSEGGSLPANILTAVNHDYANPETPVHDGDEVAFFPPITGGRHAAWR